MCVQFMIRKSLRELGEVFHARIEGEFEFAARVFPRYVAPVLGMSHGVRVIKPYQFGLIPPFERNLKPKLILHNARVETLHEKPSFRDAFPKQRCLIPLESFFEYLSAGSEGRGLYRIQPEHGGLLVAAGLFTRWKSPDGKLIPTFTMITRPAPEELVRAGHDRCPYFLDPKGYDDWLQGKGASPSEWYGVLRQGRFEPKLVWERFSSESV